MKQISFSDLDYLAKRKITKKERFLAEMERVVPFARLEAVIEPHYPKTGSGTCQATCRVLKQPLAA